MASILEWRSLDYSSTYNYKHYMAYNSNEPNYIYVSESCTSNGCIISKINLITGEKIIYKTLPFITNAIGILPIWYNNTEYYVYFRGGIRSGNYNYTNLFQIVDSANTTIYNNPQAITDNRIYVSFNIIDNKITWSQGLTEYSSFALASLWEFDGTTLNKVNDVYKYLGGYNVAPNISTLSDIFPATSGQTGASGNLGVFNSTLQTFTTTNISGVLCGGIVKGDICYLYTTTTLYQIDVNTLQYTSIYTGNFNSNTSCCLAGDRIILLSLNTLYIGEFKEYNITYNFSDNNGNILSSLTGKLPISRIGVTFELPSVSIQCVYIDGSTDTVIFDVPTVTGKRCIGFSTQPNSLYTVLVEGDNVISLESDTTFYPVYVTYRPPATVFYLNLYKNTAEPNRLDKTDYLEQVGVLEGAFREESSLVNMNVIIQQDTIPTFNYVYIPILKRYYYVTDIASVRYGLWRITLEVDVLMSYKDAIRQCFGFCERNEFQFNDNIIDRNRVIEQGADVSVTPVTNELFTDSDGSVVVQGFGLKLYTVE